MLNFRVDDLDAVLEKLRTAGADIDPKRRITTMAALPGLTIPRATG
jgi:hypothetical protein